MSKKSLTPPEEMAKAMFGLIRPYYKDGKRRVRKAAVRERRRRPAHENQEVTLKDATFVVMEDAVAHVSGGGRLPVGVRRLFYAVRAMIQEHTTKRFNPDTGYEYFRDTLVRQYQEERGPIPGLYFDPRGRLYEPHTEKVLDLGTLQVADYEFPHLVFDKILYIEKEGHWPLLNQAKLRERYDMAIVMGKGYPTEAVRTLFKNAEQDKDYQLFVLHDADPHGYNIARVLREETERMPGYSVDVIDIGLKLEEALSMGLELEEFTRTKNLPAGLLEELSKPENALARKHFIGERKGPKSWLCKRVELDAMTAPQEVEYIERKLEEAGVRGKVIPPEGELQQLADEMYRREQGRLVEEVLRDLVSLDEVKEELADQFIEEFELENARQFIEEGFKEDRTLSWRSAFKKKVRTTQEKYADDLTEAVRKRVIEVLLEDLRGE